MYDYLIVGCGLFGSTMANKLTSAGKKVLIIDKRNHIGGNIHTEEINGIRVHKYGPHIFHTNNEEVWKYLNTFCKFNRFTNCPIAIYKGKIFSLPFNMHTFYQMWGVKTPKEAKRIIDKQRKICFKNPKNLEERAISLVGRDIYKKLIKGYSEKQWGRDCKKIPAFVINRLPLRYSFNNNYFESLYQGIPIGGYTTMIEKMLLGVEVRLGCDFFSDKESFLKCAKKIIFTGSIDSFYDFCFGRLEYRTIRFETEVLDIYNFQGNAVVNYTEKRVPWTRIIEHKWFDIENCKNDKQTIITKEFPQEWNENKEPLYPINDAKNNELYNLYYELSKKEKNVYFGGRLGSYKYYDMDQVVSSAFEMCEKLLNE